MKPLEACLKDNIIKERERHFYPIVLNGCQGIVFTKGIVMEGWAVGKVCPGCISETVRYRKRTLGRDIGCGV